MLEFELLSMATRSTKASQSKSGPELHVGIFWLVDGTLLTDSTPLDQAEPYRDHLTHPRSHIDAWDGWQKLGKAPVDVPYEEPPVAGWCSTERPANLSFWLTSASLNARVSSPRSRRGLACPRTSRSAATRTTAARSACSAATPKRNGTIDRGDGGRARGRRLSPLAV